MGDSTVTLQPYSMVVTDTTTQEVNLNFTLDTVDVKGKNGLHPLVLPGIMFFVGVFGNVTALIILQVRPSKDSRSTAFYHLVKALAFVDLTGQVALSPVPLATQGQLMKTGGMALCHYFSFAISLAGNATLSIVVVMAVERLMVTKFPFQYPNIITHRNLNLTLGMLWFLSALIAALPIFGVGRNSDKWPGTWCFFDYRSDDVGSYINSILFAGVGILVIVITCVINTTVIHHLWRMRRSRIIHSSIRSPTPSAHHSKGPDSETKMVLFLMAIIIAFTLCYSPLMVRVLMNQFQNVGGVEPGGLDDRLDVWAIRLASFNQIIDPWIYIISRFTCCSGRSESSRQGNVSRSPNKTTTSMVSNSPSPRKSRLSLSRGLDQARIVFSNSRTDSRSTDNIMVPLNSEFAADVNSSYQLTNEWKNTSLLEDECTVDPVTTMALSHNGNTSLQIV